MTKQQFQKIIWTRYKQNKREFPWRNTRDPYRILVSEIMLQQTQTDRVVPKYKAFLKLFPTFKVLARASTTDVLIAWQGLGYNRRALNLKRAAEKVVSDFKNKLPSTLPELISLPGIGHYTAGALLAFAFDLPSPFIETNIRTVYLHFFFNDKVKVHDKEILKMVENTLPQKNIRDWYYALMDYGVLLKKENGRKNINQRSVHYKKQSTFKGSHREMRSKVLKLLLKNSKVPLRFKAIVQELTKEGFRGTIIPS
jgi:A/G-specific adenine glycosylase